jgi:hypothetical protein
LATFALPRALHLFCALRDSIAAQLVYQLQFHAVLDHFALQAVHLQLKMLAPLVHIVRPIQLLVHSVPSSRVLDLDCTVRMPMQAPQVPALLVRGVQAQASPPQRVCVPLAIIVLVGHQLPLNIDARWDHTVRLVPLLRRRAHLDLFARPPALRLFQERVLLRSFARKAPFRTIHPPVFVLRAVLVLVRIQLPQHALLELFRLLLAVPLALLVMPDHSVVPMGLALYQRARQAIFAFRVRRARHQLLAPVQLARFVPVVSVLVSLVRLARYVPPRSHLPPYHALPVLTALPPD